MTNKNNPIYTDWSRPGQVTLYARNPKTQERIIEITIVFATLGAWP